MSKSNIISDGYWLRTHAKKNGIPADCVRAYQFLFNQGIGHFKDIIDDIIGANGGEVRLPMQPEVVPKGVYKKQNCGETNEYKSWRHGWMDNRLEMLRRSAELLGEEV